MPASGVQHPILPVAVRQSHRGLYLHGNLPGVPAQADQLHAG